MTMKGYDISHYQPGINIEGLGAEFLIMKATEGRTYTDPVYRAYTDRARKAGILTGAYTYLKAGVTPYEQASMFLKAVQPDIGKSVLALDAEDRDLTAGTVQAVAEYIHEQTGVYPLVYFSASRANAYLTDWLKQHCGLWIASWGANPQRTTWPTGSLPTVRGGTTAAWQFSSRFRNPAYAGNLDADIFNGDRAAWQKYAKGDGTTSKAATSSTRKSSEEIAQEVIQGKWGNGNDRKTRLENAGYDYATIQALVNQQLRPASTRKSNEEIAREVIQGKWGNGNDRKTRLGKAGYDYATIQALVNQQLKK